MLFRTIFTQINNNDTQCFFEHISDQKQNLTCKNETVKIEVRHIE